MSVFVTKALQQVWCSPEMDYQRIYSPGRLTRSGGVLRSIAILFDYVELPTTSDRYHVFQLGNRRVYEMGIVKATGDAWVDLATIINDEQLQLDVYTDIGRILPAKDVYLRRISDTNLIIAVRDRGNLYGEREESIFLRSYRNAWFATAAGKLLAEQTFISSTQVNTTAEAADLYNKYIDYSRRAGAVRVTINGLVSELTGVGSIKLGSHVDMFYDGAVHWTTTMLVSGLKMYYSTLDNTEKFIIHPPKSLTGQSSILYHDDVDFYVITGNGPSRRGLFLHSNVKESQRMLTHNDYAIRVSHVNDLIAELGARPEDCAIHMVIRKGKEDRELSYERHFIHELYKLPDSDIVEILAEEKATIKYWTAECLENAYYTKIMRSGLNGVSEDDALKAFGYGGCTVEAMQSPIALSDSVTVNRPLGFRAEVLALANSTQTGESNMFYLGASTTVNGQAWPNGAMDFRLASSRHRRFVYHNIEAFDIPTHLSFTAYRAVKSGSERMGVWEDVTLTNDYAYENGRFKWLIELPLYDVMVVPGDYSDIITQVVDYPAEELIDLRQNHSIDGNVIPTAETRAIANGQLLTPGVDFIVSNGYLQITNLAIGRLTSVVVQIARTGCATDRPRMEYGFVMGQALSHNNRYDLHGSTVKSVIAGNKLIPHDELAFAEDGGFNSRLVNGSPYVMSYYRGPIINVPWWKISDLRDDWDATYSILEDYLSGRMNEHDTDGVVTIEEPIYTFSPFIHKIVSDLLTETLTLNEGRMTDEEVRAVALTYSHLLAYEPSSSSQYDARFIDVAPIANENMVYVSENELYFLHRLNDIYLNGVLNYSPFIGVSNE